MKKPTELDPLRERPEMDFSNGVRAKHAFSYGQGTNVVLLDDDLLERFPTSKAVNKALRLYISSNRHA